MQLELGFLIVSGELVRDQTSRVEIVASEDQFINGCTFSGFPYTTCPESFLSTILSDLSDEILKDCGAGVYIEIDIGLDEVESLLLSRCCVVPQGRQHCSGGSQTSSNACYLHF